VDLRDYVRLLRRRWRLIALATLLGIAAATIATLSQTKIYTANFQFFVSAQSSASATGGDISSAYTGGLFTQQRVKSYADVLQSPRLGALVAADLKLRRSASAVAQQVTATAPLDTVLINMSVSDPDPAMAQRIAHSIGVQFPRVVEELERPASGAPAPVKVSVIQPAALPQVPTSPRPTLNLALGFLVGLGVGVAIAVLRETLDTSVKTPDQAEELVGAPMLGAITFDPDASKSPLVVQTAPTSLRSEAFRQMRTNLQFVDIEHALRSVVLTSSVPGEGKSTTTCNLSVSLAQAGVKVVLIEGDLRRPRVAEYMGLEGAVGLTSVLLGRVPLEDALQPWGDGTLRVLPSGPLPPNPSELLGSAGMEELLRRLEGIADIVLIDAPPLLPVTDAAVLGAMTSGLLMLVRYNRTHREAVRRAGATAKAVGATVLGVILNAVPTSGPDAYAYGFGYGGYYGSQNKAGKLSRGESAMGTGTPQSTSAWTRVRGRAENSAAAVHPGFTPLPDPAAQLAAVDVLPHLEEQDGDARPVPARGSDRL